MTLAGVWTDPQGYLRLVIEGNGTYGYRREYAQTGIQIAIGRIDPVPGGGFYAVGQGAAGLSRSRMWLAGPDMLQEQNEADQITGFFNELLGSTPPIRTFYRAGGAAAFVPPMPPPPPYAPPYAPPYPPPVTAPLPPNASVVDVLLAQAQQATPEAADALFRQAIAAAAQTATIDDDIVVVQQLVRSTKRVALSDETLGAVASMIIALARQPARRDEVAHLLAWAILAVNRKGVTARLGHGLVEASRDMLNGKLGEVAHVNLAMATAQALVALGEPHANAELLLDIAASATKDAGLLDAIEQTRRTIWEPRR